MANITRSTSSSSWKEWPNEQAGITRGETRINNGMAVITLHGEIDGSAEATLQAAYDAAGQQGVGSVLLNFGDVGYINSTGIASIVGLLARACKERSPIAGVRAERSLPADFRDHTAVGFHDDRRDEAAAVACAVAA